MVMCVAIDSYAINIYGIALGAGKGAGQAVNDNHVGQVQGTRVGYDHLVMRGFSCMVNLLERILLNADISIILCAASVYLKGYGVGDRHRAAAFRYRVRILQRYHAVRRKTLMVAVPSGLITTFSESSARLKVPPRESTTSTSYRS